MSIRFTGFSLLILCLGHLLIADCFAGEAAIVADRNAPRYQWGRGLTLPALDLTIGGYANLSYKHFETKPAVGTFDDLSLFLTWRPHARLRFFTELELEDFATIGNTDTRLFFSVERLYADFFANQHITLRVGKSLTPVGRWNLIHAAPLVWTSSRPLVTETIVFPAHTTGLMVKGSFFPDQQQDLDLFLYADDSSDLDPKKQRLSFENGFGGRVVYQPLNGLQIGASYLDFKELARGASKPRQHLFGLDLFWTRKQFEIQSEMVYRLAEGGHGDEKGLYLQGVAPLGFHLFAVGRYEYFDRSKNSLKGIKPVHINLGIAALAWRPYAPLVVKAEYRFGSNHREAPSGFFTSIAFFF